MVSAIGFGFRAVSASLVALVLVLPLAACSSSGGLAGHVVSPEKLALKQGSGASVGGVQSVQVVVSAPSEAELESGQAVTIALTSYLEAQVMYVEYLDMAESADPDFEAVEALGDRIEAHLAETEPLIRGAALALQAELGADWRDESLLEEDDLVGGDGWATATSAERVVSDLAAPLVDGFPASSAAYVSASVPTSPRPAASDAEWWADSFSREFDKAPIGNKMGTLATMMNTDVKTIQRRLEESQGIVRGKTQSAVQKSESLWRLVEGAKSGLKVLLIGAGMTATWTTLVTAGPVLAGIAGVALCVQGGDMLLEIVKGGAAVVQGMDGKIYAGIEEGQKMVSATALVLTLPSPDKISVATAIGDVAAGAVSGSVVNIDITDGPQEGEKVVDATMVPPAGSDQEMRQKLSELGLDAAADYSSFDSLSEEQMKEVLAAVNDAVRDGKIEAGSQIVIVVPEQPVQDAYSGSYDMTISWPDGFTDSTTAQVTLQGTTMTITPADPSVGTMTGPLNPTTGVFTSTDTSTGLETTVTFTWAGAVGAGRATGANATVYSSAVGVGYSFKLTRR